MSHKTVATRLRTIADTCWDNWVPVLGVTAFVLFFGGGLYALAVSEDHGTFEWREAHLPCHDEIVLVGPHAGQPNSMRCRKDQSMTRKELGDGVLVTCTCDASVRTEAP